MKAKRECSKYFFFKKNRRKKDKGRWTVGWERWLMPSKWNAIPSNGKKAMPESRSLKLQKKYLSSVAWGAVSLTNMLTLTFQNQKWRADTGEGKGSQEEYMGFCLQRAAWLLKLGLYLYWQTHHCGGCTHTIKSIHANKYLSKCALFYPCISHVCLFYQTLYLRYKPN